MFTDEESNKIKFAKTAIEEQVKFFREKYPGLPWHKMYLSGGAIASLLQGEKPNDWDLYCFDRETMEMAELKMLGEYLSQIQNVKENYREFLGKDGKMITENAITMNHDVQVITKIWGTPAEIKKTFDFVHCTPHYSFDTGILWISKAQLSAITNKKLVYNNPDVVKVWRVQKFKNRGYTL